jgi:hypothetical protein
MKPKSNISTCRYSGVAILSTLKAMLLVLILLKTESNVEGSSGAAGAVAGAAEAFTGIVNGLRGQLEVNGDISKYTRSITTNYKGVKIEQTWYAEQGRKLGDWRYLYTCESAQFTDQTLMTSIKPFEISENGSRYGDVPLEVRNFSCTYNYPQQDGGRQLYSFDNQTEFQVRVNSKYIATPWLGGGRERVSVLLLNWTPERSNCDPVMGFPIIYRSFGGEIPVNGFGYITVRSYKADGNWINLSSGDGAGFGFN